MSGATQFARLWGPGVRGCTAHIGICGRARVRWDQQDFGTVSTPPARGGSVKIQSAPRAARIRPRAVRTRPRALEAGEGRAAVASRERSTSARRRDRLVALLLRREEVRVTAVEDSPQGDREISGMPVVTAPIFTPAFDPLENLFAS